ncbi:MAG: hypothetical protein AB1349_10640 [Elusimicrobiota bacterium]
MRIIPNDLHLPMDELNHLFYLAETKKDFSSEVFEVRGKKYLIIKIGDDYKMKKATPLPEEKL